MDWLICEEYFEYQLGLHLFTFEEKYVYLFSECCRHKQNELEVKWETEIHNTTVKVEINRQIEIYISNSRTHLKRRQLKAV